MRRRRARGALQGRVVKPDRDRIARRRLLPSLPLVDVNNGTVLGSGRVRFGDAANPQPIHFGENVVTVGALGYFMINSAAGVARVVLALLLTSSTLISVSRLTVHGARQTTSTTAPRSNEPTARIRGRVFAADTGKPVPGAIVTLVDTRASNPNERQGRWIRTDADGRWEAQDLRPGAYVLSVSKAGYLKIEYGQKRPFERGKSLDVAAGQVLERIALVLTSRALLTRSEF